MNTTQKVYEVTFSQRFDESRTVFAKSEEDAEQKVREVWGDDVGGEVVLENVSIISETTEDHQENYDPPSSFKFRVEPLIEGVRDILRLIDDSPTGRMLTQMQKYKEGQ
tara:strand:+ start:103 stop:429 length:327 start_codon:yes stop_codon:yes gene_type:complete